MAKFMRASAIIPITLLITAVLTAFVKQNFSFSIVTNE
jgi:hypothetical protein